VSDLSDPGGTPTTPPWQVAVRHLDSNDTTLVSGEYDPGTGQTTDVPVSVVYEGTSFGAVYPGTEPSFEPPPANGKWGNRPPPGASISADGSTVAWMGDDIARQARMLSAEDPNPPYTEPLWRRIAPGSETPTERVTGGSDPNDSACAASGETVLPPISGQSASDPCQGPFRVELSATRGGSEGIWSESDSGEADFVPRLSADGYTVAFIASAVPVALGIGFSTEPQSEPADVYVANMHPGPTRDQALTPLTQIAGVGIAAADPVTDLAISADGRQVAFTTRRTEFPLGSPAYISPPQAEPGESELFDVDLADDTLTRVTRGLHGEPSEQATLHTKIECPEDIYCMEATIGAQSPSFSADGELLAFASTASNLVFGDGNAPPSGPFDGSDAFVVGRQTFTALPTPQFVSAPPGSPIVPLWQLGATALSRRDGSVVLYLELPGPGSLRAGAQSALRVTAAPSTRHARSRRSARKASRGRGRRTTVVTRTVASAARVARAQGGELTTLTLRLAKPYAALASRRGGLSARVELTFTGNGHPTLRQTIEVAFVRTIHTTHKRRAKKRAKKHGEGSPR
jgi:WD40-like Beta Propeller Repeat